MKMKHQYKILVFLAVTAGLGLLFQYKAPKNSNGIHHLPAPTQIKWDMEEGNKSESRKAWFELMHAAAPGVDWKVIEEKNRAEVAALRSRITRRSTKKF